MDNVNEPLSKKKERKMTIQTWLPLPNYKDSIRSLAQDDLEVQRLYVLELIEFIHDVEDEATTLPASYRRHSQTAINKLYKMWWGYELQLIEFGLEACDEYSSIIAKRDPLYDNISRHLQFAEHKDAQFGKPQWFGDINFHHSHQALLVRKNPEHYGREFRIDPSRKLIYPVSDIYPGDEEIV
jgi:hypothetical protein